MISSSLVVGHTSLPATLQGCCLWCPQLGMVPWNWLVEGVTWLEVVTFFSLVSHSLETQEFLHCMMHELAQRVPGKNMHQFLCCVTIVLSPWTVLPLGLTGDRQSLWMPSSGHLSQ